MTDPALIRLWPKKWLDDPDIRPALRYLDRYLHDFRETTDIELDSQQESNYYANTIPVKVKSLVTKTISNETYYAANNMFINMTNNATLYLPANPCADCVIYFTKDNTGATINPNGKKLNGSLQSVTFRKERLARQIFYFVDADEWFYI